jgi:putative DNA modification/repair radical SAM protein
MDTQAKLAVLADAAKYDASCASSGSKQTRGGPGLGSTEGNGICHSYTPDGRCISLLKILLTNFCIYDCKYCVNRVSSDVKRARFTVDEVVRITLEFYRRNYIEGLFLSSGIIKDGDYTMEQLIAVAKTLRVEHGFKGYIHLKTIPGANDELVQEAGLYADRLSVNIELPTHTDLQQLAPEKSRPQLENNMASIQSKAVQFKDERKTIKSTPLFTPAGQSTQMIVGATPTPDKDILHTASSLYKKFDLRRVYYSAFSPIPHADSRLPGQAPPLLREHRLYQADWMLRFYGFDVTDIVSDQTPDLDIHIDPKTSWALRNPSFFPINVNTASREQLLRIPGVGVQSVNKILQIRRYHKLRTDDLLRLRISYNRAKYFIATDDPNPLLKHLDRTTLSSFFQPQPQQLLLAI